MTTASSLSSSLPLVGRRGWTSAEFDKLIEAGVFAPDERLELLAGDIVSKMTQNPPHSLGVHLAEIALNAEFTTGFDVRSQLPLALGERNRPEPDVAVVTGSPRDYLARHPATALLVVEISDATLQQDREVKAAIYAQAGIEEFWIVNLLDHVVEVHRGPAAMSGPLLGYGYRSVVQHTTGQTLSPLAAPAASSRVADLLP